MFVVLNHLGDYLIDVARDGVVGDLVDRGFGIGVDRDDHGRTVHTRRMLDLTRNTAGDVKFGTDRNAGLAHLTGMVGKAGVHGGAEPGGFSRAIRVLADAGISVEYAYAFITPEVGAAYVIIRVENNEDATAVLTKAGIKLIEQNEIFA